MDKPKALFRPAFQRADVTMPYDQLNSFRMRPAPEGWTPDRRYIDLPIPAEGGKIASLAQEPSTPPAPERLHRAMDALGKSARGIAPADKPAD